jgi:uncharacterized protein YceK
MSNKVLITLGLTVLLSGCSTIESVKKYWPRDHDPVMFDKLVQIQIDIKNVDCENQNWNAPLRKTEELAVYTEWRDDPQKDNMNGLFEHVKRMNQGGSKVFCELGKKTSQQRIEATKNAWKGR